MGDWLHLPLLTCFGWLLDFATCTHSSPVQPAACQAGPAGVKDNPNRGGFTYHQSEDKKNELFFVSRVERFPLDN